MLLLNMLYFNNNGLVKSLLDRHPGESRGPEHLELTGFRRQPRTRSGVRRNDQFYGILTFYEFIDRGVISLMFKSEIRTLF